MRDRLVELVEIFLTKIYDPEASQLRLFFEEDWTARSSTYSYGHDIETSWLLLRATDLIDDAELSQRARAFSIDLARTTAENGLDDDGGIFWSGDQTGPMDTDKHHWVQAEAILGFVTAYRSTGDPNFAKAADKVWAFTKTHILDKERGEWFGRVSQQGVPYVTEDKIGLWKCPYHNARACFEVADLANEILVQ